MLLALDIGNTNVTVGLFKAGTLVASRRAATIARSTADELELLLEGLLRLDGLALAATAEYTRYQCRGLPTGSTLADSIAAGQAAIVTSVNRVVGVYEKELAVRLVMPLGLCLLPAFVCWGVVPVVMALLGAGPG